MPPARLTATTTSRRVGEGEERQAQPELRRQMRLFMRVYLRRSDARPRRASCCVRAAELELDRAWQRGSSGRADRRDRSRCRRAGAARRRRRAAPASAAKNAAVATRVVARRRSVGEQPRGLPGRQAQRLDVDVHVGRALRHRLKQADGLAELLPPHHVLGGHLAAGAAAMPSSSAQSPTVARSRSTRAPRRGRARRRASPPPSTRAPSNVSCVDARSSVGERLRSRRTPARRADRRASSASPSRPARRHDHARRDRRPAPRS